MSEGFSECPLCHHEGYEIGPDYELCRICDFEWQESDGGTPEEAQERFRTAIRKQILETEAPND